MPLSRTFSFILAVHLSVLLRAIYLYPPLDIDQGYNTKERLVHFLPLTLNELFETMAISFLFLVFFEEVIHICAIFLSRNC